jgi:allantoinase
MDRGYGLHARESPSAQGYTPFEGLELTGRVEATFLRGALVFDVGKVVGTPQGHYVRCSRARFPSSLCSGFASV